jgi:ABC-type phosphate/phosphonate transport system substrate-binding protein
MKNTSICHIWFFLFVIFISWIFSSSAQGSYLDTETIHIGVIAKTGKVACFEQWQPTAAYLKEKLPDYKVQIVCLDYDEVDKAVSDKHVDFTITIPSIYVKLEYNYGSSRIATFKNRRSRRSYTQMGGVIIY